MVGDVKQTQGVPLRKREAHHGPSLIKALVRTLKAYNRRMLLLLLALALVLGVGWWSYSGERRWAFLAGIALVSTLVVYVAKVVPFYV